MTTEVVNLNHDGFGVARDEQGKTIFIDGALPGEHVTYEITKKKRRFSYAKVTSVQNPAKDRVEAKCAHFLVCGGCSNQHISPEAQLAAKQASVLELLLHFGGIVPENLLPPLTGPIWGYRNKARLGVRYVIKKDKVLVGFREKHSSFITDINQCEILNPLIGKLILPLKELLGTMDAYRNIAQIEVAIGDERLALIFRNLKELIAQDQAKLINFASAHDFDLYLQPGAMDSIYKVWPTNGIDRLFYSIPEFNVNYAFHPSDFTQINPVMNRKMVAKASELLDLNQEDRLLDLFCGIGNFSLALARQVKSVVGVEGSELMVNRAYENAKRNQITNVEFYAADLTTDKLQDEWTNAKFTKILLDPPRSGAKEILPLVAKLNVEKILYVSCNPATFARDAGILTSYGYKLSSLGIMDMFPHTSHVETIAILQKNSS